MSSTSRQSRAAQSLPTAARVSVVLANSTPVYVMPRQKQSYTMNKQLAYLHVELVDGIMLFSEVGVPNLAEQQQLGSAGLAEYAAWVMLQ